MSNSTRSGIEPRHAADALDPVTVTGDTWISDLRHFLGDDGEISPIVYSRSLVRQLCALVEAVSGSPSDLPVARGLQCRRRPGRRRCAGTVEAGFDPGSTAIRWVCPVCGDNGWIAGWHGTHWDRGGRSSLPEIKRLIRRQGLVGRTAEIERLPSFELSGPGIPREVVVAIHDNELIGASGEYGLPEIGEPLQYDELRIEHGSGIDRIIVYNHAIMLFKSADEIYPRILRVLVRIDRVLATRS